MNKMEIVDMMVIEVAETNKSLENGSYEDTMKVRLAGMLLGELIHRHPLGMVGGVGEATTDALYRAFVLGRIIGERGITELVEIDNESTH